LRIILDSGLTIPVDRKVLTDQQRNSTLVVCTERAAPENVGRLRTMGVRVLHCKDKNGRIDLNDLMEKLGGMSVDSILLEGGAAVNDSAFSKGGVVKKIL